MLYRPVQRFWLILTLMCTAHVLGMIPFSVYPALIPTLQLQWNATNTEIGWIAGIYFAGYLLAVLFLVPLTDRVKARNIYLFSMMLSAVAPVAFAFFTDGVVDASIWRFLQGVGLAGTYMPGLKALVDAAPDHSQSRTVALYTMCFGIGVAVSFLTAGYFEQILNWHWVFALSACGPAVAFLIAIAVLPHGKTESDSDGFSLLPDFRPVLRNRITLGFSITYSVHNAELFVFRSWAVAFLVFAMTQRDASGFGVDWNPSFIVACATLIAQPFSVFTNEIASRINRVKVIVIIMGATAVCGVALGFSSQFAMWVIVAIVCAYAILTISDSASITSAVVTNAASSVRGTTMAFHTLIGFIGAFLGPILFGAVLDIFGGSANPLAWATAFSSIAALAIIGYFAIGRLKDVR